MMNFQDFIRPELLILIPVLVLIGTGIKKSKISDSYIPLILGITGIVLAAIYLFATVPDATTQDIMTAIFTAITQGILCAGASDYATQLDKPAQKED